MSRYSHAAASVILAERDPVIAGLHATFGPCRLRPRSATPFEALVRAIVFQQLSGRAAGAIFERLQQAVEGELSPEAVQAAAPDSLRGAGLSAAKAASILDLAQKVVDGTVPLDRLSRLGDDELVGRLVVVRGIGRWTAEMFLLFQLRRLDVWPVDDLAVRKGYMRAYGLAAMPSAKDLGPLGDPFRPYRSIAAWYLWRASEIDTLPG